MSNERRFTKDEAQRIFAAAAERQQSDLRDSDTGLTLQELEEAAASAGLDPAYVRAAAADVLRPGHAAVDRRVLGLPVERRQTVVIQETIDDEEWGLIVRDLRRIFKSRGVTSEIGPIREWSSAIDKGKLPVQVTAELEESGTRITIEHNTTHLALGLGIAAASQLLTGLILAVLAVAGASSDLWFPGLVFLGFGLIMSVVLYATLGATSSRSGRRFEDAFQRIRETAGRNRSDTTPTAAPGGSIGHGRADESRVDDLEGDQSPETGIVLDMPDVEGEELEGDPVKASRPHRDRG